jgi:uridine kinase
MARPIILGVVGDSAAGKTTITRGLVRVIGDDNVTHVCTDDYHRFDRRQGRSATSRRSIRSATTSTSWRSTSAISAQESRS